jgi:hypothetical protein
MKTGGWKRKRQIQRQRWCAKKAVTKSSNKKEEWHATPPEPFIEDFRTFLGFMAALYWLNECTTIGTKRVGGVAYSF